ncbi:MAG: MFS transporter [Spirochaetaceae bacterium]|jgi:DHA3 family macrolide efflux protein-like MFS transporter|nr:MFS transporter [Spirochaetaceae bacterium]
MEINWKKNTALFLTGQALSMFGSMVVQYAIMWHITLKTQSGIMITIFTILGFLPMFFISPFGGVWADRFNRKYIINISDGAIAFASLVIAVFLILGFESFGILLIGTVVRSLGQGVQMPAVGAFIPQIVPERHLTRINGIQSGIQSFITLTSPAASAALMSFTSLKMLFFVDVITAAFGISVLFFFVKVPEPEKSGQQPEQKPLKYLHDLKEGLNYIKNHEYIFLLIIFSAVFMFFASPSAMLTPLQVSRNFGNEVWRLSAIEIAFSAGMMAGGLAIGFWGGFKNRIFTITLSCALFGIEAIILGIAPVFWIYICAMVVVGITMPLYNTPLMVILQTSVEPEFMGRVLSVITMLNSVMMPLGMLVFGPLSDAVSINLILVVTGIVMTLLCIPYAAIKSLRKAGQDCPPDTSALTDCKYTE